MKIDDLFPFETFEERNRRFQQNPYSPNSLGSLGTLPTNESIGFNGNVFDVVYGISILNEPALKPEKKDYIDGTCENITDNKDGTITCNKTGHYRIKYILGGKDD